MMVAWEGYLSLTLNRTEGGGGGSGIRPQAGSSLCCAETVSSRKLKLFDFYYILIVLNSKYKPSHGTSTVAMVVLLLKGGRKNFGKNL